MDASRRFSVVLAHSCQHRFTSRWIIAALAGLVVVALMHSPVLAASGTWSVSAPNGTWSTATNWTSSNLPGATTGTTNTDTATFNNNSTTKAIVLDTVRNLENITFDAAAGAYTIGTTGGNALLLTSGGEVQIASTFSTASTTETVNAPLTLEGSYTFADSSTLTGDLLSFGGAITSGQSGTQTLTVTTVDNVTIGGAIGGGMGTIALLKTGTGTLTLNGNNTFTGGVQVNAGTLQLGNAGALNSTTPNSVFLNATTSSATLTLAGNSVTVSGLTGNGTAQNASSTGANLTVSNSGSDLFSGVLQNGTGSGTFGIIKAGAGVLTLSGNNTFTGNITINAGTLQVGSSGALGTSAGGNNVFFGPSSTGILSLNGNSISLSFLQTDATPGTPIVQNASATPATLTLNEGGTYAGVLQDGAGGGTLALVIASNAATLTGNNTFTGGVSIGSGVLFIGNAGALNSTAPNTVTFGSGSAGTMLLSGNSVTVSGLNTNATLGTPLIANENLTTPATLTVNNTGQNTYNGLLQDADGGSSASLALLKSGNGTLALGGANTFTGGVTINAGAITIGNNSALGTGTLTVNAGTLQSDANGPYTVANPISLSSSLTVMGSSNLTLSGSITGNGGLNKSGPNTLTLSGAANSFAGTLTITSGTVNMNSSLAGNVANDSVFVYNGGTFSGRLTNAGTVTFNGPFTAGNGMENDSILTISSGESVTLNGNGLNNTGTITLAGGSLTLGAIDNFNSGTFNCSSTVPFNLGGSASFTNTGTFNLNGGYLAGEFAADFVNEAGAVVVGSGTIQAPFSNSGGTLQVGGGTTNVTVSFNNSSGLVQLTAANADLVGGTITNPAAGTIQGQGFIGNNIVNTGTIESIGGTLTLNGSVTNSAGGLLAVDAGSKMLITQGLATNSGIINLTGGTFDNSGQPLTNGATGQISGWGIFRTGGLTNNGSITFSGGFTTVNGPVTNDAGETITVAQNPAIFTGHVTNNSSATFNTTNTTVTFAGGFTNNGSSNFVAVGNAVAQIDTAPTLNASSALNISGPGTLSFDAVSGAAVIGTSVTATVASGATLELAGTVSALGTPGGNRVTITNSGTVSVTGTGQVVGGINNGSSPGAVVLANDTSLTADHIIQGSLVIGSGATFTIDPSDANGSPLTTGASDASSDLLGSPLSQLPISGSGLAIGGSGDSLNGVSADASSAMGALEPSGDLGTSAGTAVPEPSTLLLALLSLGCLAWHRRRSTIRRFSAAAPRESPPDASAGPPPGTWR